VKKQLLRISDYTIYGFQYVAVYFFRGFTSVTVAMALTVGLYLVTASWLVTIFGEERTTAFIVNHPNLFTWSVLLFTVCTGGLAYWSFTRNENGLHAGLRQRLAKHSKLSRWHNHVMDRNFAYQASGSAGVYQISGKRPTPACQTCGVCE
jgi:hypothetical protein